MTISKAVLYLFCAINFLLDKYVERDNFVSENDKVSETITSPNIRSTPCHIAFVQSVTYPMKCRHRPRKWVKGPLTWRSGRSFLPILYLRCQTFYLVFSLNLISAPYSLAPLIISASIQLPDYTQWIHEL